MHAAEKFVTYWNLSENQLDIPQGGRVNTIAVNPMNDHEMFVASETGGLFKSVNRGLQWTHVDTLPVIFTQSVAYLPSDPGTLFVTAKADFKVVNGGGVWRSTDGGQHWEQRPLSVPGSTARLSAYEISILSGNDNIVIGTSEGLFVSVNHGTDWTPSNVFGNGDRTVFAVLIEGGSPTRIYAGGPSGVRLGTYPLTTWTTPVNDPGASAGIRDIHAFGHFPLALSQTRAFVVNGAGQLFRTEDRGGFWSPISLTPPPGACGGTAFVRAVTRSRGPAQFLDLYFGNRCNVRRFIVHYPPSSDDYSHGVWQPLSVDHAGPRDLALFNNAPILLGTTGGLHNTADAGLTWTLVGGGRAGGFNALQINEVKGQTVRKQATDLYVGTQDNNLWAATISGAITGRYETEGHYIEVERKIEPDATSRINFVANAQRIQTGRRLVNPTPWPDAPNEQGAPALIGGCQYVQNVKTEPFSVGLAVTDNCGAGWQSFAPFPEQPRDLPKLARSGSDPNNPSHATVVYQAYKTNVLPGLDWASRLLRIEQRPQEPVEVRYPAMGGTFGSLGINPTMFAWYQVYAVDPGHPDHIIAPEILNNHVMQTLNGGMTWENIPDLTAAVLAGNGRPLLFKTDLSASHIGEVFPVVTAVSFCPDDPNLVLAGTSEGGIYRSLDNGWTWKRIEGTERATYITSFFWKDMNTIFVSTYGRGLWRLANVRIAVPAAFDELCGTCDVVSNDGSPAPTFAESILAFEGSILAVRTEKGQLREVLVTPGTSVIFTGDQNDPHDRIAITEGTEKDAASYEPLPQPKSGIVKGLVLAKDDQLVGTIFGESEATLFTPAPTEDFKGSAESPTSGRPYIQLVSADMNGITSVAPNESFDLSATDFVAGTSYEMLIDGVAAKGTVTADGAGAFNTRISAPADDGYHRVEIRKTGDAQILDGSVFVVRYPN